MKVHVEELSPIERKLTIEVEPNLVNQELNQAYATLGRQVKIAGFRPGKIPRRILEQRFKQEVEDDVIRRVVDRAYREAIREHHVEAVSHPRVTNEGLKPDLPFKFQARVDVKPKLQAKDYQELSLKRIDTQIDDTKVAEQLERMRQAMTRLEPVEGRDVAEREDFALVDYHANRDGKPFPGSSAENAMVEVVYGDVANSKVAALEGARVGETKEFDYTFPDDYSVPEIRGKTARFRMHLKGLKTKVVPELNDDFAKEVQGGQTLEELKAKVRADLEKAGRREASHKEREEIVRLLIERNPFEVPEAMVDRAVEMMLENSVRSMANAGVDPRKLALDYDQLRRELRPRALGEVKGQLLLEAIAQQEGIVATDAEIEKRIEEIAKETGQHLAKVRKYFREPDERKGLERRLREEKTLDSLKARAKYL